jgi:hypothetical protein
LWVSDTAPASNEGNADTAPAGTPLPILPARGGTVLAVIDLLPSTNMAGGPASGRVVPPGFHITPERSARHRGFHRTDTVDYVIVLEGQVWAVLDEGETMLKAGDVLIQRGTFHAWDNRSDQVCRLVAVSVDAEPLD